MLLLRERGVWGSLVRMGWRGWLFVVQSALGMSFYLAALRHTTVAMHLFAGMRGLRPYESVS
jgi:hypothetical protein